MEDSIIVANNLGKRFEKNGNITAVDGISLTVHRGEVYGIIGPDGAGKTTLTRLLIGLLSRSAGESSVLGYNSMEDPYEIRERIGYVAQQYTLPPELTVMENMLFFANTHGVAREDQKQRINELLEFTGLSNFTDRITKRLSGGMKKKLALSCSLIQNPLVLFLDEPTLGVDPVSRREFWTLLSTLRAEQHMTIFVSTPYMDEAERCNQIGLLYQGKMIANGAPHEIKNLVPGELLEFTPDANSFDEILKNVQCMEGVIEVQTYGIMLHVFVDTAGKRKKEIEAALKVGGYHWHDMRVIEPRMEEAFISLINRQQISHVNEGDS